MGQLEIISVLCEITQSLSELVNEMSTQLEQADISEEVRVGLVKKKEECEEKLNSAEYKMRRIRS